MKRRLFLSKSDIHTLAGTGYEKEQLVLFLENFLKRGDELVTSFPAFQEMMILFHEKNKISSFRNYAAVVESLMTDIIRPDLEDLYRSLDIMEMQGTSPETALDCAICLNRRFYLPEWHPGGKFPGQIVITKKELM